MAGFTFGEITMANTTSSKQQATTTQTTQRQLNESDPFTNLSPEEARYYFARLRRKRWEEEAAASYQQ